MTLYDPMKAFCKEVEDVWGRFTAKNEHEGVVKFSLPMKSQQMPICAANGDVSVSIL